MIIIVIMPTIYLTIVNIADSLRRNFALICVFRRQDAEVLILIENSMIIAHSFPVPTRYSNVTPVRAVHVINDYSPSGVFMYMT